MISTYKLRALLGTTVYLCSFLVIDVTCASDINNTPMQQLLTQKSVAFHFDDATKAKHSILVKPVDAFTDTTGFGYDLNTTPENNQPFYFSIAVPEGNYRVTMELGAKRSVSSTTIKAESRRLYLNNEQTRSGKFITRSFVVNVRNAYLKTPENLAPGSIKVSLKPRELHSLHWDNKLTLEVNGDAPQLRSLHIEPANVPTLFLVGDSTVTDQPYEPAASWGQMLPYFFNDQIAVANHAESGETLKSFISEARLAKVLDQLKAGDYLFIQFGHNDQKKQWPQTYVDANTTYKDYLKAFVNEAKLRGATPVLITSMQRRKFDGNGRIVNTHGDYPNAVRELADAEHVALIDLDVMSVAFYEALGVNKAPLAFNDNGKDATHHNNYGAYEFARCVVQGIRNEKLPLVNFLKKGIGEFNPAQPDDVDSFKLSASPASSQVRPDGN